MMRCIQLSTSSYVGQGSLPRWPGTQVLWCVPRPNAAANNAWVVNLYDNYEAIHFVKNPAKIMLPCRIGGLFRKKFWLAVTVKTFELLPDQGWIWLDFPDFKHWLYKRHKPVRRVFLPATVRGLVIFTVTGRGCAARVLATIPLATETSTRGYGKWVKIKPLTIGNITKLTTLEANLLEIGQIWPQSCHLLWKKWWN